MKKGFTLVELLAVIVILAIIALIAVPIIMNIVESSRKGAATSSAYGYIDGVKIMYAKEMLSGSDFTLEGTFNVDEEGKLDGHDVEVEGTKAKGGYLTYSNGKITEGCLTIGDYKVTIENDTAKETIKGACEAKETEPKGSPIEWFTFEDNENGTATVTGLSQLWHDLEDESKYEIAIPSKSPSGNIVTRIGSEDEGFYYTDEDCDDMNCWDVYYGYGLTSVTIPDSVTTIEDDAFQENNLTSVTIPNSVKTIGWSAFQGNNLTSVIIPDSVTTIGGWAFRSNNLTSVDLGNGVQTIGAYAFYINNLTNVTIPNSVTTIGEHAFSKNNLTSVKIPDSVTTIGNRAFYYNNLTIVDLGNGVQTIGDSAFDENSLTSLDLGNGVQTIGRSAFSGNNLTSVTIPDSVIEIGAYAFSNNDLESLDLGNGVQTIGAYAFPHNDLTSVTIPDSVTTIGDSAFYKSSSRYVSSNTKLAKIINETGKEFDWGRIVNGSSVSSIYTFITGTVVNSVGDVTITDSEE